jgi:hypothetical protein
MAAKSTQDLHTAFELSIVVPFDVGRSYVFKPSHRSASDEKRDWDSLVSSANQGPDSSTSWIWTTDRLGEAPAFYREPLGPVARCRLKSGTTPTLTELAEKSAFYSHFGALEVVFFTRGIGVLLLRGTTRVVTAKDWRVIFHKDREHLKEALLTTAGDRRRAYLRFMDIAANKKRPIVFAIDLPNRRRELEKIRHPHVIAFTSEDVLPEEQRHRASTLSFKVPVGYRYISGETDLILAVDVGWGESTVYKTPPGSEDAQAAITEAFVTAMASWYSLVLMTSLVSNFLRNSFVDMANKKPRISDRTGQTIRFMFMDTSTDSRPVRWAVRERDIILLDRIHTTWSTERWWRNVEERTTLLTAHHNEVAAGIRRQTDKRLGWLLIGLAAITSLSAVRDVADVWNPSHFRILFMMLLMLLVVVLLGLRLLREESDELDE